MGPPVDTAEVIAAVVTVVFDRADYLRRHADSLLSIHNSDPRNMCAGHRLLTCCDLYLCFVQAGGVSLQKGMHARSDIRMAESAFVYAHQRNLH